MEALIRGYTDGDLTALRTIWNAIVEEGIYFPQDQPLSEEEAERFFASQSYTGVAELDGELVGLYILHPNNVGRCGHIANASYAVKPGCRGKRIGEKLVADSLRAAAGLSFRILQFNAVVASNAGALRLYDRLGFTRLGTIPGGFRLNDGSFEDIIPFYKQLV